MQNGVMTILRLLILQCIILLSWLFPKMVWAADYLPPEQAFQFDAQVINVNTAHPSVQVIFKIAPDYYMYRDEFAFTIASPDGRVVQNGAVKMPAAQTKFDENFGKEVAYYHNTVKLNVPIRVSGSDEAAFKLVVASRGCADKGLCYPPRKNQVVLRVTPVSDSAVEPKLNSPQVTANTNNPKNSKTGSEGTVDLSKETQPQTKSVEIKPTNSIAPLNDVSDSASVPSSGGVSISASTQSSEPTSSLDNSNFAGDLFENNRLLWALFTVFGLGVLLSLTPCMFPMFPILTVLLAGQQKSQSRWRGLALAFAYVTGMALIYALVGVIAARTGVALQNYLQNPWVLLAFSGLLVVLALSMFDVFQIQMPERWQLWLQNKTQGKNGYWGALMMGAASALIASPCVTAPLVGLISYIAQTGQVALGGLALLVLAYGMGLPLLLLGAGLGQWLPKAGGWMTRVKMLIGILMLGVAVWVAQPVWSKYWQQWRGTSAAASVNTEFKRVSSLNEIESQIAQSDRPILIDLYADWCRSCIEMEHKTFSDPRVRQRMAQMQLLRVDMTQYTEQDSEILKHFGLYGPPGIIILEPQTGREKGRIVGFEPAEQFLKSLERSSQ